MIENDKNNRDLVFKETNHSNMTNNNNKKYHINERNAASMEPYEKRKSKGFTPDLGPYTHPQSINEKENVHILTKKESGVMPKLNRMPSKNKFDRKNSIEKC